MIPVGEAVSNYLLAQMLGYKLAKSPLTNASSLSTVLQFCFELIQRYRLFFSAFPNQLPEP